MAQIKKKKKKPQACIQISQVRKIKATEKGVVKLKTPEAFPKKTKAPQSWV